MRALILLTFLLLAAPAFADEAYAPDDAVTLTLSTEGYAVTHTALVTATVDAAATDAQSGAVRETMQKAIAGLAGKAEDWKLTGITRSQDDAGLTRWQATYEARLAEGDLGDLAARAQKVSKPGQQVRVANIAFTPTLAETEAERAGLRQQLYKQIGEELARLNAGVPGRAYRISQIAFDESTPPPTPMAPRPMMMKAMAMDTAAAQGEAIQARLVETARVTLATRPAGPATK